MAGYIDREALVRKLRAEADKCKVGEGDTLAGLYLANCIVDELPASNVVLVNVRIAPTGLRHISKRTENLSGNESRESLSR